MEQDCRHFNVFVVVFRGVNLCRISLVPEQAWWHYTLIALQKGCTLRNYGIIELKGGLVQENQLY